MELYSTTFTNFFLEDFVMLKKKKLMYISATTLFLWIIWTRHTEISNEEAKTYLLKIKRNNYEDSDRLEVTDSCDFGSTYTLTCLVRIHNNNQRLGQDLY